MKIAFILTQSLESPSGLGRYGPMARELVKMGHQIELFALHPAWDTLSPKSFSDRGVSVQYVSQMHVRKEGSLKSYYSPWQLLWIAFLATLRLTAAVWRADAEILHVCKPQPFNLLAAQLARRRRPIFVDSDDYEAQTNKFNGRFQQKIVRYFEDSIVRFAAGLTTNTHFNRERYIALGFPAARITLIPNGVEAERFPLDRAGKGLRKQWGIPADAPLIAYIGTLGLHSHPVDLLLRAFAQINGEFPAARLLLAGGGEDIGLLQTAADTLGIGAATIFTGRIAPDQIAAYYATATLSVDPVHDDLIARARSPLKLMESVAMGTPVISSDVGDRRILLQDQRAGLLVPAGDAEALAAGIRRLLRDGHEWRRMAAAARAARPALLWSQLAQALPAVYETG